ncbi:hypothetical protein H072_7194 [Dactylellina haptotyla CBS 200.50]|uniref:Uncharacterized protein n=1 Tax=Dactylellina haptotyla (strain CBS 200.50) TaxID=1284197 RepID=S8A7P4_DACHA|nr:hypothetical protein H072_7194 [Dactylellina haptotyla CBS 200.50]
MSYKVFRVEDRIAVPDMPSPRYHNKIFVETEADGSGFIHHVTGDLVSGMHYEVKKGEKPESSEIYHAKHFVGTIGASEYPANINEVLERLPAPGKQKSFNTTTMRTEQHKSPGEFYAPGESRPPMFKCTEWTIYQAIPALEEAGVIHK